MLLFDIAWLFICSWWANNINGSLCPKNCYTWVIKKKNNILRYKNKGHFLWRIIVIRQSRWSRSFDLCTKGGLKCRRYLFIFISFYFYMQCLDRDSIFQSFYMPLYQMMHTTHVRVIFPFARNKFFFLLYSKNS